MLQNIHDFLGRNDYLEDLAYSFVLLTFRDGKDHFYELALSVLKCRQMDTYISIYIGSFTY